MTQQFLCKFAVQSLKDFGLPAETRARQNMIFEDRLKFDCRLIEVSVPALNIGAHKFEFCPGDRSS